MKRTYFIYTWGCAMNQADAERIAGEYESRGYTKAKSADEADEIVLTTCSVRKSAEDRVLGLLNNFAIKFKDTEKKPKIIVTGCMLHHKQERLQELMPNVDEFLPITEVGFNNPSIRKDKHHMLIPISTGCNSFCTYCIVPLARGREKSRPMEEILTEINQLTQKGYTEVTLLGQNVNSFGLEKIGMSLRKRLDLDKPLPSNQSQYRSFEDDPPFVTLLDKVCAIEGIKKVNFMSSNPWDFYEELIDCLARNQKINREIHLPFQSGDNEILQKMNRGYTREQYLELVKRIRVKIPEAEFTTDIIVGFPGETDEQFEKTVDVCRQVHFNIAYIGKYSPRPGTVSAKTYLDDVPAAVKKKRWKILNQLVNKMKLD